MQETRVQSLGQEDPLQKEMATHSRILAWRIPGTQEPGGLQSMGSLGVKTQQLNNNNNKLKGSAELLSVLVSQLKANNRETCRD